MPRISAIVFAARRISLYGVQAAVIAGLLLAVQSPAADAKGKKGNCTEERRVGKGDDGKKYDCLWDACKTLKCDTKNGKLENCRSVTTYSNPRDCKPAKANQSHRPMFQLQMRPQVMQR